MFADDPPTPLAKEDSPVSPLLQQFIDERQQASTQKGTQSPGEQTLRGLDSQTTSEDSKADSTTPPSDGPSGSVYDPVRFDSSGNVQVYVNLTNTSDSTLQQLRDLGANIEVVNYRWNKLQAWVPVDALDRIAGLDAVRYITPPDYASTKAGSVVTEGDGIHRADLVRNLSGLTGKGVRVGVISDGVDSWRSASASRDLPGSLQINPNISRTGDEGTALLEIVHDLAPNAKLAFSSATSSLVMAEAILWLANNAFNGEGVDIIVDDLNVKDVFLRTDQWPRPPRTLSKEASYSSPPPATTPAGTMRPTSWMLATASTPSMASAIPPSASSAPPPVPSSNGTTLSELPATITICTCAPRA